MKDRIDVLDFQGYPVFIISVPDGRCFSDRGEQDPRHMVNAYGDKLLSMTGTARGQGVHFTYFRVDGSDLIRLVELDHEDEATYRQLFNIFHADKWWEVCETVEEQLACNL